MKPRTTAGDRACIWSWVTEISSHNVSGFQSEWKSVLMADYNLIRPNRMDTETKVLYRVALILLVVTTTLSAPTTPRGFDPRSALKWLKAGGYTSLPYGDIRTMGWSQALSEVRAALPRMKQFYGLLGPAALDSRTLELLQKPRCGRSDQIHSSNPQQRRRHKRDISYLTDEDILWKLDVTVGFRNYLPESRIPQATQEEVAKSCFKKWEADSGLSFRFVRDEVPNIYIQFDEIDGEDGIAGTGESPAPWRDPPTSNLTLDIREPWKARASTSGPGLSLQESICHEMGHTLNLGHSGSRENIMFTTVGFRDKDVKLGLDDIKAIVKLYGDKNGKVPQVSASGSSNPESTPESSSECTGNYCPWLFNWF